MRKLLPNGTIGVFAPSSAVAPERTARAEAEFSRLGYALRMPIHPSAYYADNSCGFSNGTPQARAEAFHALLDDPDVEIVLCSRGGYGAMEILELIDFEKVAQAGKLVIGYSDVTAILLAIAVRAKVPAIHGPSFGTEFANAAADDTSRASTQMLLQLAGDEHYRLKTFARPLRVGCGEGPIVAANLAMLNALASTPYDPDLTGAVLVLEEVGEAPYRVHRALMQLKLSGKLERLSALVFGRFSRCEAKAGPNVETAIRLFVERELSLAAYPILVGLEFGHNGLNIPLPLLCRARVAEDGGFSLIESPLQF